MAVDPLYPVYVQFPVAQHIWDLFQIHIWQFIINNVGKEKAFRYLKWRYEKNPKTKPAAMFMITVFVLSWLILVFTDWLKEQREMSLEQQSYIYRRMSELFAQPTVIQPVVREIPITEPVRSEVPTTSEAIPSTNSDTANQNTDSREKQSTKKEEKADSRQ